MASKIKKRDFVKASDFSPTEFDEILALTEKLKNDRSYKSNALSGLNIALIFTKPSLRTKVSFEVGINQLGGKAIILKNDEISIGSRESAEDIANVLSRYVDGIVIRTFEQSEVESLGIHASVPVINALSDYEHPCQAYADFFTIKEHFKTNKNLKISYIGDGNNVTNSLIITAALFGANISIASPEGYYPCEKIIDRAKEINSKIKIEITSSPIKASKDAHILYTDVWTSMGQEKESELRKQIFKPYQINSEILSYASKDAIVLHCLPAHKGEEISSEVFNKFSNIIYTQAENRLHTQKAILLKLLDKS